MRQALELAKRGLGHTAPNPAVGCVIVQQGRYTSNSRGQLKGLSLRVDGWLHRVPLSELAALQLTLNSVAGPLLSF